MSLSATLTQNGGAFSSTDSLAAQAIGTASAGRVVVVLAEIFATGSVTVASIGGVSATITECPLVGFGVSVLWVAALVPTGTTATVTLVNASSAGGWNMLGIFAVTGGSALVPFATDTDVSFTSGTTTLATPAGGVILGLGSDDGSASPTLSWTAGLTNSGAAQFSVVGSTNTNLWGQAAFSTAQTVTLTCSGATAAPATFAASFGPSTTAVTANCGVPYEFLSNLRRDGLALLEWLTSVRVDRPLQLESLVAVRRDNTDLPEFIAGLSANTAAQLEFLGSTRRDNLGPLESASALRSDVIVLMETLAGQRSDRIAATEILASLRADLVMPIENQGTIGVTGNAAVQIETTSAFRSDATSPFEAVSSFRADTTAPLEFTTGGSAQSGVAIENTLGLQGNSAVQTETLSLLRKDGVVALESISGNSAQSGVPIEIIVGIRNDSAVQTETQGGVGVTGSAAIQLETTGSVITQAGVLIENFLAVSFSLSGMTLNSAGVFIPFVTVLLFRTSDNVFIASVTSDAGGNYSFMGLPNNTTDYFVNGYLTGAPDLFGTTSDKLTPS